MHYLQHNTSIKLVVDRQTDIATYRAAIAAQNPTSCGWAGTSSATAGALRGNLRLRLEVEV